MQAGLDCFRESTIGTSQNPSLVLQTNGQWCETNYDMYPFSPYAYVTAIALPPMIDGRCVRADYERGGGGMCPSRISMHLVHYLNACENDPLRSFLAANGEAHWDQVSITMPEQGLGSLPKSDWFLFVFSENIMTYTVSLYDSPCDYAAQPPPSPTTPPTSPPTPSPTPQPSSPPTLSPTPLPTPPPTLLQTPQPTSSQQTLPPNPPPTSQPNPQPTPTPTPPLTPPPTVPGPPTPLPTSSLTLFPSFVPTHPPAPMPTMAPTTEQPTIDASTTPVPTVEPGVDPSADYKCADWTCYCSRGTKSGNPCLPGVEDFLGQGFDIVTGKQKVRRIIELEFAGTPNMKVLHGKTYEIPSHVQCIQVSNTLSTAKSAAFTSSLSYQSYLAGKVGLSGVFKSVFFSQSSMVSKAKEETFQVNGMFVESSKVIILWSCSIESAKANLTSEAKAVISDGRNVISQLGTHVVNVVDFGGRLLVTGSVESCVLNTMSTTQLETTVSLKFSPLFLNAGSSGEVYISSACDFLYQHSTYARGVTGGDSLVFSLQNNNSNVLDKWSSSVLELPSGTDVGLIDIRLVADTIFDDQVEEYFVQFEGRDEEIKVDPSSEVCKETVECQAPNTGTISGESNYSHFCMTAFTCLMTVYMLLLKN